MHLDKILPIRNPCKRLSIRQRAEKDKGQGMKKHLDKIRPIRKRLQTT